MFSEVLIALLGLWQVELSLMRVDIRKPGDHSRINEYYSDVRKK